MNKSCFPCNVNSVRVVFIHLPRQSLIIRNDIIQQRQTFYLIYANLRIYKFESNNKDIYTIININIPEQCIQGR